MQQTTRTRSALRLAATGLFGVTMLVPPVEAVIVATLGASCLAASFEVGDEAQIRSRTVRLVALVFVSVSLLLGILRGAMNFPEPAGFSGVVVIAFSVSMLGLLAVDRQWTGRTLIVVGIVAFAVLSLEVMVTFGGNLYGLDVYRSHEAAGDAIRAGANPYSDAVTVADGSPNASDGDLIEGYSYPPVTLVSYVTGDLIAGDPRWTSVVAVGVSLAVMAALGRSNPSRLGTVLLMLLAVPLYRTIIWSGWTEPLSLALLATGVLLWSRGVVSTVLIGLALASKQYLVLLVPLLAMIEGRPWRRSIGAVGVAALTLVPAALADFSSFWFTMVVRPLSLGFRADAKSVSGAFAQLGIDIHVPTWMMLVAVVASSAWVARRVRTRSDLLSAMALILAVTFLMSLAFTNYWWLVQWLAGVSAVAECSREVGFVRSRSDVGSSV